MLFNPTDQSRNFADQARRSAALSGVFYGPVTLVFLLFSAWVKLGRTSSLPYAYAFGIAVVALVYYYNIVRRGWLFNHVIDTVWVSEGKLFYRTNHWLFMKPTEGTLAMNDLTLTRKSIMHLNLIELSSGPSVSRGYGLYLIENSLVNEQALLNLIEEWSKDK
jgi:hypothetical protein